MGGGAWPARRRDGTRRAAGFKDRWPAAGAAGHVVSARSDAADAAGEGQSEQGVEGEPEAVDAGAAGEAGVDWRYFNHSAGSFPGTVTAIALAKIGRVTWVAEWHPGQADSAKVDALAKAYKTKMGRDFLAPRIEMTPHFVAAAINKAQSTDPKKIALAMEDMSYESSFGPVRMRAQDHAVGRKSRQTEGNHRRKP